MDKTVSLRQKLPAPLLGISIDKAGSRKNETKCFDHNVWVDFFEHKRRMTTACGTTTR
jgi:hypothetical protein